MEKNQAFVQTRTTDAQPFGMRAALSAVSMALSVGVKLGRGLEQISQKREEALADITAPFREQQTTETDGLDAKATVPFHVEVGKKALKAGAATIATTTLFAISEKLMFADEPTRKQKAAGWLARTVANGIR